MNGNIKIANLFGIPFYINPSWLVVLALVTFDYGYQLSGIIRSFGPVPWLLGLVTALLLFASVLAHELGHALVAISQGIKVKSITLFLFGGLAVLEKESKGPLDSFLVAIAGPAVSLALFGLLTLLNNSFSLALPLRLVVEILASLNLVLGLFNLIPGLPLDGGNILKAIVWKITGDPNKGILIASRFGQFFGFMAIAIGLLGVLKIVNFGGIWTFFIGLFLLQNANLSAQSVQFQQQLEDVTAADVMIERAPIAPEDLNLREFANNYIIGQKQWKRFLLKDDQGKLSGVLTVENLKTVPTSFWSQTPLTQLKEKIDDIATVSAQTPLLDVLKLMDQKMANELLVISKSEEILGLVDRISIGQFLQKRSLASSS